MRTWWEKCPSLLEEELRLLGEAGIPYVVDEEAKEKGKLFLTISPTIDGKQHKFIVKFPDFYPFLQFEIFAPHSDLKHHQTWFGKNLCILPRGTINWDVTDRVAQFVKERIPKVLEAGSSDDREGVKDIEVQQGEPISDYFPYDIPFGSVLFDGSWKMLEWNIVKGDLELGYHIGRGDISRIQYAVIKIKDGHGNTLAEADSAIQERYPLRVSGRWLRLNEPFKISEPKRFYEELVKYDIAMKNVKGHQRGNYNFRLLGILFPEEVAYNNKGDGWIFLLGMKESKTGKEEQFYFHKAERYGRENYHERIPEVAEIKKSNIAQVGVGCLGAPSALEFAKNGIGELRILDHDRVDAGTTVRWPLGLEAAGVAKILVLKDFIACNYPFTRVTYEGIRIGNVEFSQDDRLQIEVMDSFLNGVDLVYDASAEIGINHLLSTLAAEKKIPYIELSTTHGAWGGRIVRIIPGVTEGCWFCYRLFIYENEALIPNSDQKGDVQPHGCADITFTGASFDTGEIVLAGVRLAISTILKDGNDGYPNIDWDIAVVNLRDKNGLMTIPQWHTELLKKHPSCPYCNK